MSRDCYETGRKLITPHVEIDLINARKGRIRSAYVNVSAFEGALAHISPSSDPQMGPLTPKEDFYCEIYGAVGRIVNNHQWPYLNITEPSISRTLMGYLTMDNFRRELPKTFESFTYFRNHEREFDSSD